jgi:hypothetical protein
MAENLKELAEQFGEDLIYNHARRSIIIAAQGFMRSIMDQGKEKGKDDATIANEIVEAVRTWKPSQKKAPKSAQEKARDILGRLSPAERQALLKEYRAKAKEQEAA